MVVKHFPPEMLDESLGHYDRVIICQCMLVWQTFLQSLSQCLKWLTLWDGPYSSVHCYFYPFNWPLGYKNEQWCEAILGISAYICRFWYINRHSYRKYMNYVFVAWLQKNVTISMLQFIKNLYGLLGWRCQELSLVLLSRSSWCSLAWHALLVDMSSALASHLDMAFHTSIIHVC